MSELSKQPATAREKIWLASYPPGVPPEIPPLAHASLGALFENSCARYADRPAFSSMGKAITFRELEAESRKIGAWLQSTGLQKGDRVAVMLPNILQNPVVVYGILRAGYTVVNVNPLYTPRELTAQLVDSGARALFVLENFARTVETSLADVALERIVVVGPGLADGLIEVKDRRTGERRDVPLTDAVTTLSHPSVS